MNIKDLLTNSEHDMGNYRYFIDTVTNFVSNLTVISPSNCKIVIVEVFYFV